jgi:F0F1-type ATP synthase membrane subunit b/b'
VNSIFYFILATAEKTAHHEPNLFTLLIETNTINVIIVVSFFVWLIKKFNLFGALDSAQQRIIDELKNAEITRESAIKQLKESEARLNQAKDDADRILTEAEATALKIKEAIIKDAQKDAERILRKLPSSKYRKI